MARPRALFACHRCGARFETFDRPNRTRCPLCGDYARIGRIRTLPPGGPTVPPEHKTSEVEL